MHELHSQYRLIALQALTILALFCIIQPNIDPADNSVTDKLQHASLQCAFEILNFNASFVHFGLYKFLHASRADVFTAFEVAAVKRLNLVYN